MPVAPVPLTFWDIDMLITGLGDATYPVRWWKEAVKTGTHMHTQGNMYVLLLRIITGTSRHSTDNTQYYGNRHLCDSGTAVGVAHIACRLLVLTWTYRSPFANFSPTFYFSVQNSCFICPHFHRTVYCSVFPNFNQFLISPTMCLSFLTSQRKNHLDPTILLSLISYLFSSVTYDLLLLSLLTSCLSIWLSLI